MFVSSSKLHMVYNRWMYGRSMVFYGYHGKYKKCNNHLFIQRFNVHSKSLINGESSLCRRVDGCEIDAESTEEISSMGTTSFLCSTGFIVDWNYLNNLKIRSNCKYILNNSVVFAFNIKHVNQERGVTFYI